MMERPTTFMLQRLNVQRLYCIAGRIAFIFVQRSYALRLTAVLLAAPIVQVTLTQC